MGRGGVTASVRMVSDNIRCWVSVVVRLYDPLNVWCWLCVVNVWSG
jgi:hypothetical protein